MRARQLDVKLMKCCLPVLIAQETDWMDKLEKQLRRSPKMAADAEEISEELDVSIPFFPCSIHFLFG